MPIEAGLYWFFSPYDYMLAKSVPKILEVVTVDGVAHVAYRDSGRVMEMKIFAGGWWSERLTPPSTEGIL